MLGGFGQRLGQGGPGRQGEDLDLLVFVRGAPAFGPDALQQHEVAAVALDGGVRRAGAEQAGPASCEAGFFLGLARGGDHRVFARVDHAARRLGRQRAHAEAVLAHHHEPAVLGDGQREHPVAGMQHKEITLPVIERVMTAFLVHPEDLAVGVDLSAGTKEKNDYTVMVLGGRIEDRIHVIDYRRLRVMGNLEKLDALKELLNDWSVLGRDESGNYFPTYSTCDIYSEAVQYQASLEADFKRVCLNNESLYNLNWHPVKGFRADKLARFRGCMGLFEDRKIIFNRYRNFTAMFEELTNFGVSSHDDCVDALVWMINGLMRKGKLQVDY